MGSLLTEGDHLFINKRNNAWKQALQELFNQLYLEQEKNNASNIIIRDLDAYDDEMNAFMLAQSFVKVDMPVSCVSENISWQTEEDFMNALSKKNRRNFKYEVKKFEHFFDVQVKEKLSDEELLYASELFKNVKNKNFGLNTFHMPYNLFEEMNETQDWEFIVLHIKNEYTDHQKPVAVGFCHKNVQGVYGPTIVGLNYKYVYEFGVYRQILYQVLKRAHSLGCHKINWGLSASVEKKKVGAKLFPKVAYVQAVDNFAQEVMETTIVIEKE